MSALHWTISRLKQYEKCPRQYCWTYLDQPDVPVGPPGPALLRGTAIHADLEAYLIGEQEELLHPEITPIWHQQAYWLKQQDVRVEEQWELDNQWQRDGPLWLRMRIDAWYLREDGSAVVIDFKTGKVYPENMQQVEVYAVAAFGLFPEIKVVHGELWYIDQGEIDSKTFEREDADKLARRWEHRAGIMLNATDFPPHPTRLCGWCPFKEICDAAQL